MFDFSDHVDVNMKATKLLCIAALSTKLFLNYKKIYLNYKKKL